MELRENDAIREGRGQLEHGECEPTDRDRERLDRRERMAGGTREGDEDVPDRERETRLTGRGARERNEVEAEEERMDRLVPTDARADIPSDGKGQPETSEIEPGMRDEKRCAEDLDYKKCIDHTPISNGQWEGIRGESKWIPNDPDAQEALNQYNLDGIEYKDGYPDFSPVSSVEFELAPEEYLSSDHVQEQLCNEDLQYIIEEAPNSSIAKQFDEGDIVDLSEGDVPQGKTWHHDPHEEGKMQLVPTSIHNSCRHLGGRSVWGGGADYR